MTEWEGYKPSVGPEQVEDFRRQVRQRLDPLTADLTAVLKRLIEHPYPKDFWQLDFEADFQGWAYDFPMCVYFYRADFDQIMPGDRGWEQYPAVDAPYLLHTGGLFPDSLFERYRADEDDFWPEQEAMRLLLEWFHDCWTAAGGKAFPYRATAAEHDVGKRLDLISGEWVEDL